MTTDAVLDANYDIQIDENGDIETSDFFDTALLYSIFGERRAAPDEVVDPQLRRGWIGNGPNFENGSKIWLYSQARLTRDNLNRIEDEAKKSLQWLVDDGLALSVDEVTAVVQNSRPVLEIIIRRSRDKIDRKLYDVWENTGRGIGFT